VNFEAQTAVVTGGTRGIGRAISLALLERGARVIATYHGNEQAAAELVEAAGEHSQRLELARFDVADYAGVEAFWNALDTNNPDGVQLLVHSAGIRRDAITAMMPLEQWRSVIDTNLGGTFNVAKFGALHMLRRRYGRIVLITSPAREHGFEGQANYSASKAGQVGLMRSLAREVAKRGITVNCVSPGFIETELLADLSPKQREAYTAALPLGRFGKPEEVAFAVCCLLARESSYITGSVLDVAGGL
jgi:3-oxoacyl-[acyl-carrier protein] reductase